MNTPGKMNMEGPPGLDHRWPYRAIRLLLVDDEAAFVDTLAHRLEKRKFKVARAYGAQEGIQRLEKANYDVAILDLRMEPLDGMDLLKIFQKMAPDMPVIILTGHGSQNSAEQSLSRGAFDYLSKPYDFEDLLTKIQSAYYTGKEPTD